MLKNKSRSLKYQNYYCEFSVDETLLSVMGENCSFNMQTDQELLELKDELFERVMELAPTILTPLQLKVMTDYYLNDFTQQEIAKDLDKQQSTINCIINGKTSPNSIFGDGVGQILKEKIMGDEIVQDILLQINNLSPQ